MKKVDKEKKEKRRGTSEMPMKERVFEAVWPCGERVAKVTRLAHRLDTLRGKTVCQLWDNLFRGDRIFPILEEELLKLYPGIKFVNYNVFGSTHGGEEKKVITSLPSMLKEKGCDAVISAVGC
jgi:hypothetical protein